MTYRDVRQLEGFNSTRSNVGGPSVLGPGDDMDRPYDRSLQRYKTCIASPPLEQLESESSVAHGSRPHQEPQPLCQRCSSINFDEIRRIAEHERRGDSDRYTFFDEVQAVLFGDGPEHKDQSLPEYYLPQEPKFSNALPVFDLGTSLVTPDGAAKQCCLCALFAFMSAAADGAGTEVTLPSKRWFLAVFKESRGDLFLIRQSPSWGEEALKRGQIVVTPWWFTPWADEELKIVSPAFFHSHIDYAFAVSEVESCLQQRKPQSAVMVPGMKLIDCQSRRVVDANPTEDYIALSYVWGPGARSSEPFITAGGIMIESRVTRTVADATTATMALGKRFLWIDRYCIDQVNLDTKVKQLGTMDKIFSQSWVTILALGSHDNHGLPGVRAGRQKKPSAWAGGFDITPFGASIVTEHRLSSWRLRAWTLQEGILSPRLLSFTDSQLFLTCNHGTVCEAHPNACHSQRTIDRESVAIPQLLAFEPALDDMAEDGTGFEFSDALGAYCSRDLTYEMDALAAFLGILVRSGLESHFGVPVFFGKMKRTPNELVSSTNEESTVGAAIGLGWWSDHQFEDTVQYAPEQIDGRVCAAFPSWSWTSCRPGRKTFAHPIIQVRCMEDSVIMHAAVICSEAKNGQSIIPWVATDVPEQATHLQVAGVLGKKSLPDLSETLRVKTIIANFTIKAQMNGVSEYGSIKNVELEWPILQIPELGHAEVRLYPDPRPPCRCHSHLHLPFEVRSSITTDITGQAALLFIDNYATVAPRYALAYFLALRHDDTTGTMRRVGVIVVSFNAEKVMHSWGRVIHGLPHEECLPRLRNGFKEALVRHWNQGHDVKTVRIR